MKTRSILILGTIAAVGIGLTVFLGTRTASAQDNARKGFNITPDCSTITLIDPEAAKAAVIDAGTIGLRGMDEPASDLAKRIFATMFPGCELGITTVFVVGDQKIQWGMVAIAIAGKTVGEVIDMAKNGEIDLPVGSSGTVPTAESVLQLLDVVFGGAQ